MNKLYIICPQGRIHSCTNIQARILPHPHPPQPSQLGLSTTSPIQITTFLKNLLHSSGSPLAFTNLTSLYSTPSYIACSTKICPFKPCRLPSAIFTLILALPTRSHSEIDSFANDGAGTPSLCKASRSSGISSDIARGEMKRASEWEGMTSANFRAACVSVMGTPPWVWENCVMLGSWESMSCVEDGSCDISGVEEMCWVRW
jgi:hypothetical protein